MRSSENWNGERLRETRLSLYESELEINYRSSFHPESHCLDGLARVDTRYTSMAERYTRVV